MTPIGVVSVGSRRSARRKRSFFNASVISTSVRTFLSLAEHHAVAALELGIARFLERDNGFVPFEVLLALERGAATLGSGLAVKRPAAEQILLQHDLDVAWGLGSAGHGLHIDAHGIESLAGCAARRSARACLGQHGQHLGLIDAADDLGLADAAPQNQA